MLSEGDPAPAERLPRDRDDDQGRSIACSVDGAKAFADWIVAPAAQQQIGQFGQAEFGQPLFTPDAGKDEASLGP